MFMIITILQHCKVNSYIYIYDIGQLHTYIKTVLTAKGKICQ